MQTINVTIEKIERLPSSENGNPKWRFRCLTEDGQRRIFHTQKDAQLGYRVTWGWERGRFAFTTNGARTVLDVKALS